jgi:hypothetical protein
LEDVRPYETTINWSQHRQLEWGDFKGEFPGDENYAAVSHNGIEAMAGLTRRSDVKVKAIFYTQTSWVETTTLSSDVLLHEQTHFDLTELYARKMRLAFDASGPDATLMLNFIYRNLVLRRRRSTLRLRMEHIRLPRQPGSECTPGTGRATYVS